MDTHAQDLAIAQSLIDTHFEIWNNTDPVARLALFPAAYTPEVIVADYAGIASGYTDINEMIDRVLTQHVGFTFTPDPVAWNHGLGRVTWGYGPKANPGLIRGEDIFTVHNGKLASLHVFLDSK